MPDKDWSTQQLKEFFEERAKEQERRLGGLELRVGKIATAVDTMVATIAGMGVKVTTIWAGVGAIGITVIGTAITLLVSR